MVTAATQRMLHERKMLADDALREREMRRLEEVRAAFFEGMLAGNDQLWCERDPEAYWLESDTRQSLYAGPPKPESPSKRAALMVRATHGGRRAHNYDPQRDPGRVLGDDRAVASKRRTGKRRQKMR